MISEKVDNAVTVWSKRLGLIILGWMAGSTYHGTATLTQKAATLQHVQTVEIPKLAAQAHCEDARADKATTVAGTAILSASVDNIATPKFRDLPADNCVHAVKK